MNYLFLFLGVYWSKLQIMIQNIKFFFLLEYTIVKNKNNKIQQGQRTNYFLMTKMLSIYKLIFHHNLINK